MSIAYKFSRCIALRTPSPEKAAQFYQDAFGFTSPIVQKEGEIEVNSEHARLFMEASDVPQVVFELIVPDLDAAKEDLLSKGCEIVTWQGLRKPCYVRDPFGLLFNIWEDKEAF